LEKRNFPCKNLQLLASARSKGQSRKFRGTLLEVEELTEKSFDDIQIAVFAAGGSISKNFAPFAVQAGALVIDNSSAFRLNKEVPLIIPEINPEDIFKHKGIIANPNCSTIITMTPLWPLHRKNPIQRIIASTYQAASGAGAAAMNELEDSTKAYLEGRDFNPSVLPHPYAFNLFSHNSAIDEETGYNEEELKMVHETRKIFKDPHLRIAATCIRVPVLRAHTVSVNIEFKNKMTPDEVIEILNQAPGVQIVNDLKANYFPMPKDATGNDNILVGRIRPDMSDLSGCSISMIMAGDQLLKGAALNAVQIAELLIPTM
jgi:aspartate-semialdehyde dehydrogenase